MDLDDDALEGLVAAAIGGADGDLVFASGQALEREFHLFVQAVEDSVDREDGLPLVVGIDGIFHAGDGAGQVLDAQGDVGVVADDGGFDVAYGGGVLSTT